MKDLTRKWTRECKTIDDLVELVAVEQLLEALPTNIRIWVRQQKSKTVAEAGRLAVDYVQARKQEKKGQESSKGGEPSRNQPGPRPKCDNCGKSGHRTQDCWGGSGAARAGPRQPAARADKFKEITCWKCFRKEHIAAKCLGSTTMFCDNTPRRKRASYPRALRAGLIEGKPVSDITLDTGSNRALVQQGQDHASQLLEQTSSRR